MRAKLGLLLRIAVSLLVIGALFYLVDFKQVVERLRQIRLVLLIPIFAVIALQSAIIAARWSQIAEICGASLGIARSIRVNFIGMFFNQLLPGTLGGNSMRVALSVAEGVKVKSAVMGILIDRAIALVALVGMVIAALPWLAAHLADTRMVWAMAVLAVSAMLGFLVFIWLIPRLPARWRRWTIVAFVIDLGLATAATVREGRRTAGILLLAVAGNLLYGVVLVLCADGLGVGLHAVAALILMMPALFAMALPISVAGWGVREGILVVGLGQLGVPAPDALALSLAWGIVYMLAGIPGGVLWIIPTGRSDAEK